MTKSRTHDRSASAGSQPRLDRVLDLLVDAVCAVDAEGRFVFLSAACERIFGYSREEMLGRNMIEFVHPDDRERTLAAAAEVMLDKPLPHFENRYLRKDGSIVHVMWSARWSAPDGVRMAVARDVTELRHAERLQGAIYRISEAAQVADGMPALYREIHGIVRELLPAERFLVALYEHSNDTLSYVYVAGGHGHEAPPNALQPGTPIARVIRTGKGVLASLQPDGSAADAGPEHDCTDWLGVPLVSPDGVIGALVVCSPAGGTPYTAKHRDLLQFVSAQIASAIERKRAEARLQHLALHDPLTGLPNRALFDDRFDMALRRAQRGNERLALLYVDLDDFKEVNDAFGHGAGDLVLQEVARRLSGCVRASDTVARLGGDEFAVLLANVHGADAAGLVADKVRGALQAPFELGGGTATISASVGAAVYPEHGAGKEQLLHHADAGMYAAKLSSGA